MPFFIDGLSTKAKLCLRRHRLNPKRPRVATSFHGRLDLQGLWHIYIYTLEVNHHLKKWWFLLEDDKPLLQKVVVRKPTYKKWWLDFQGLWYTYIWSRFAVRYHPPPPPPHGMVPKPAFCSIPHENVVFAVFFAWWVAGAVRNPANSLDFCNQPSENVLFAMFRLRHRGVVPPRPLLFLCQIIIQF